MLQVATALMLATQQLQGIQLGTPTRWRALNTCCSHVALVRLVSDSTLAMSSSFAVVNIVAAWLFQNYPNMGTV